MPTTNATTRGNAARGNAAKGTAGADSQGFAAGIILVAGWLVPGLGHFLQGYWIRAVLLFAAIVSMFALGLAMHGKIYAPNTGSILDTLGFIGDLGNGLMYFVTSWLGIGQNIVQVVTEDYGTKFVVVAGLLNFIAAVDAHRLRVGRKQ